jgi:hypothetical protein
MTEDEKKAIRVVIAIAMIVVAIALISYGSSLHVR